MIKLILLLLLLPTLIFGAQTFTIGVGSQTFDTSTGSQTLTIEVCQTGTYLFAWNGDYGTDTDKGCFASGASQKDGTQSGGTLSALYGKTGVGLGVTGDSQYITWAVSGGDGINIAVGTVWIDVYIADATPATTVVLFECFVTHADHLSLGFTVSGTLQAVYEGASHGLQVASTDTVITGWNTLAYSWSQTDGKHSVKVNNGTWKEDVEALDAWGAAATSFTIGENGIGIAHTETIYIDNVYSLSGYQTAHP